MRVRFETVCVLGLGIVGAPTIQHIHECGFQVFGYDLVQKSLRGIKTFTDWRRVPKSDVYVVTVPTDNVEEVCEKISKGDKTSLIAIESTVPIGTCRRISETFDLHLLVHCPHRYWSEDPVNHGIKQLRVIGAINKESLEKGLAFYQALGIPLHTCSSVEVAEMCKIAENAYRFVQIAFAEELRMICEQMGLSFNEVREACNTKWNIQILEARDGIIGSCLPKDIQRLKEVGNMIPLLNGAILTDEMYRNRRRKR